MFNTYGHRTMRILLPVRSADIKHSTGGLVVRWVTTSEYLLSYVFVFAVSRPVFCSSMYLLWMIFVLDVMGSDTTSHSIEPR
jgi:hypothetical protein